jgi:predicted aspartyl protease
MNTSWIRPAIVAAAIAFPVAGFAQDCHLKQLASLDMSYDHAGRPLVTASLEGQDVKFLIDTAGAFGALNWSSVDSLKLHREHIEALKIYMPNGERAKYLAHGHDLRLGNMVRKEYPFIVLPPEYNEPDSIGSIAPDVLSAYDIEFDFAGGKFSVFSQQHCKGQVIYWTKQPYVALPMRVDRENKIYVTAVLDGTSMKALIDTGSDATWMSQTQASAVLRRPLRESELLHVGTGASRGLDEYRYAFKSLAIGGIAVQNPDITIVTDKLSTVREPDEIDRNGADSLHEPSLTLGASTLKKLHLYIAYSEQVLYATGADTR